MNNENPTNPNETNELGATALGSAPVSDASASVAPVSEPVNSSGIPTPPVAPENGGMVNPVPAAAVGEAQASASPESVNLGAPVMPTEPTPMASEIPDQPVTPGAPTADGTVVTPSSGVAPVTEPVNNANADMSPIEQPIPGTNGSYNATSNVNSNGFVEPTKVADVGTVPPAQKEPKEKKPMNKVLFIILIVVLLAAIAYGVYYYLSLGKSKTAINVKTNPVTLNLGDTLSTDINDYAQITGTNPKNCVLHTENVDVTNVGNYEYTVVCSEQTYKGAISIVDNAPLMANPKNVYVSVGSGEETPSVTYKPEDFIEADSCNGENCVYSFNEDTDFTSYVSNPGIYEILINISDGENKTGEVISNFVVLEKPLKLFMVCSKTDAEAGKTITDRLAIGPENEYINYAERVHTYTFTEEEDYLEAIGSQESTITYDDIVGQAIYNKTAKTLTIMENLGSEDLNNEAGGTFPNTYLTISEYYKAKGITCTFER